jgi:hypothetical protein
METRSERMAYVRIIAKGQLGYAECRTERNLTLDPVQHVS